MNSFSASSSSSYPPTKRLSLFNKLGNYAGKNMTPPSVTPNPPTSGDPSTMENGTNAPGKLGFGISVGSFVKNEEMVDSKAQELMPPPQFPPQSSGYRRSASNPRTPMKSLGNGSDMRKLMDDLQKKRKSFNEDQHEFDKTSREIKSLDERIRTMTMELSASNEKYQKLGITAASKRTELNVAEVKGQVLDQTLKTTEEELNRGLKETFRLRLQTGDSSSAYLADIVQCSLRWNCTELGMANRQQMQNQEMEVLKRQNRQLKYELEEYLNMRKAVDNLEKEVEDLDKKFKETDAYNKQREDSIKERLHDLKMELMEVRKQKSQFNLKAKEELERLSKEIEKAQSSVSSIEALSADAKTTLKGQNTKVLQEQQGAVLDSNKASSTFRRFQPPVKPPNQSTSKDKSPVSKDNSMSSSYFPDDVDDEFERNSEELACLAAAEEISQEIRELNPAKASRSTFSFNRGDTYPAPAKVPATERQAPITAFMKQFSSAKVIKRPSKAAASQAKARNTKTTASKPVSAAVKPRTSLPAPSRSFQFKKKMSLGNNEKEKVDDPDDIFAFMNDSNFNIEEFEKLDNDVPGLFNDIGDGDTRLNSNRGFRGGQENCFDFDMRPF